MQPPEVPAWPLVWLGTLVASAKIICGQLCEPRNWSETSCWLFCLFQHSPSPADVSPGQADPTSQSGQPKGSVVTRGHEGWANLGLHGTNPAGMSTLSPGFVGSLLGGSGFSHRGWTHQNPVVATLTPAAARLLSLQSLANLPFKLSRIRALLPNTPHSPCF